MRYDPSMFIEGIDNMFTFLREFPKSVMFGPATLAVFEKDLIALDLDDSIRHNFCFGLQWGSEFTEMFNHHIKKLGEQGVIKKIISKWLPPPSVDFEKKVLRKLITNFNYLNWIDFTNVLNTYSFTLFSKGVIFWGVH